MKFPPPAEYYPVKPRFDVSPALRPLGTEFGNGAADGLVFQIDRRFPRFRAAKEASRSERLGKYHLQQDYPVDAQRAVHRFMAERLCAEHPAFFRVERSAGLWTLHSDLTGDTLAFSTDWDWLSASGPAVEPGYASGFDALACQVQEDLAVTLTAEGRGDWLAALHVCNPSGWVPEEKIGLPFVRVHQPVPGMERVLETADSLVRATIDRGPWVRFVWTLVGEDRLNHHPEPPPGVAEAAWRRTTFNPEADPPFWFRVERQVLWGLPEVNACLFVIGPYHSDPRPIRADPERRSLLSQAIRSMTSAALEYKGLAGRSEALLAWLEAPR